MATMITNERRYHVGVRLGSGWFVAARPRSHRRLTGAREGSNDMETHDARIRAMGSDAHVIVVGGRGLLDAALARIDALEQRWSRFIESSEISELNRHTGDDIEVSAETRTLVAKALEAVRLTGGGFDPTVLGDVIRAGYDRTFEELPRETHAGASALGRGATNIHVGATTVRLPRGVGFDPGGIGKGLAAD